MATERGITPLPYYEPPDYTNLPPPPEVAPIPDRGLGGWAGDTAKGLGQGAIDIARMPLAYSERESALGAVNETLGRWRRDLEESKTPAQRALDTGVQGFADRPVGYVTGKMAEFAPWVVLGSIVERGAMAGGAALAGPAGAVAGGALGATFWAGMQDAQYRNAVSDAAFDTPIEMLQGTPQWQQVMQEAGGDERRARTLLRDRMIDDGDRAINALVGGVTGVPIAGPIARGLASRAARMGVHAGEAGLGLAGQTAASDLFQQRAEVRGGIRERVDAAELIDTTLEAGLAGAGLGAGMGALSRGPGRAARGAIDTAAKPPPLALPAPEPRLGLPAPEPRLGLPAPTEAQRLLPPPTGGPFSNRPPPPDVIHGEAPSPGAVYERWPPGPPDVVRGEAPAEQRLLSYRPSPEPISPEERFSSRLPPVEPEDPLAIFQDMQRRPMAGPVPRAPEAPFDVFRETADLPTPAPGQPEIAPRGPYDITPSGFGGETEVTRRRRPAAPPETPFDVFQRNLRRRGPRRRPPGGEEPPPEGGPPPPPRGGGPPPVPVTPGVTGFVGTPPAPAPRARVEGTLTLRRPEAPAEKAPAPAAAPAAEPAPTPSTPTPPATVLPERGRKGKATVQRVRTRKQAAKEGPEQLPADTRTATKVVPEAPAKPSAIAEDAAYLGKNAQGRDVWEKPDGTRQLIAPNGALFSSKARVGPFAVSQKFEMPAREVDQPKIAKGRATLAERTEKFLAEERAAKEQEQIERGEKEPPKSSDDVIEGRVLPFDEADPDARDLSDAERRRRADANDFRKRNDAARWATEEFHRDYPEHDQVRSLAAAMANPQVDIPTRMEAMVKLNKILDVQAEYAGITSKTVGEGLRDWRGDPRKPRVAWGPGAKGGRGLWHNYVRYLGNQHKELKALEDQTAAGHLPADFNSQLNRLAKNIIEADASARAGEQGLSQLGEMRKERNVSIEAAKKTQPVTSEEQRQRTEGATELAEQRHEAQETEEAMRRGDLTREELAERREQALEAMSPEQRAEHERALEARRKAENERRLDRTGRLLRKTNLFDQHLMPGEDTSPRMQVPVTTEEMTAIREKFPAIAEKLEAARHDPSPEVQIAAVKAIMGLSARDLQDDAVGDALVRYVKGMAQNDVKVTAQPDHRVDTARANNHLIATSTGKDIVDLVLTQSPGTTAGRLRQLLTARIRTLAEGVPVHVFSDEGWKNIVRQINPEIDPTTVGGVYSGDSGRILLPEATVRLTGDDTARKIESVVHELLHAVTLHAWKRDPRLQHDVNNLYNLLDSKLSTFDEKLSPIMRNPDEMLAYTMAGNEAAIEMFGKMKLNAAEWHNLGLPMSLYNGRRNIFTALLSVIARALGIKTAGHRNAVEAILHMGERVIKEAERGGIGPRTMAGAGDYTDLARGHGTFFDTLVDRSKTPAGIWDQLKRVTQGVTISKKALGLHTFDQLANRGEQAWQDVIRPIYNVQARIRARARELHEKFEVKKVLRDLVDYENKYERGDLTIDPATGKPRHEPLREFLHDETVHGAFADAPLDEFTTPTDPKEKPKRTGRNAHIGDSLADAQTRYEHARMQERYNRLSPRAKELRTQLHEKARVMNINEPNKQRIANYFEVVNGDSPQLAMAKAKRVIREKRTDAENKLLEAAAAADPEAFRAEIADARTIPDFRQMLGPYVPLMRHGTHAVRGKYHLGPIAAAHGGRMVNENTVEFADDARAQAFVHAVTDQLGIAQGPVHRRYYAAGTNDRLTRGDYGEVAGNGKPDTRLITKADLEDAAKYHAEGKGPKPEERVQVAFNIDHLEFFDTFRHAADRIKALKAELKDKPFDVIPEPEQVHDRQAYASPLFMSNELKTVFGRMTQSSRWTEMPEHQKANIESLWREAAMRSKLRSGVRARFLPRQLTKGASNDLVRNYAEFFASTANYMARLENQTALDKSMENAKTYLNAYRYQEGDGSHALRSSIFDEVTRRVTEEPKIWGGSVFDDTINRLIGISYIDKLASPSFLMINSTEPWMLGVPLMGARHGAFKTINTMRQMYDTVGALKLYRTGWADLKKAAAQDPRLADYHDTIRNHVMKATRADPDKQARYADAIDWLAKHDLFNRDAGQEIERTFTVHATKAGKMIDYVDNIFRTLNTSVENVNRAVTGLTAYELEYRRTGDHQKSMDYAQKMVERVAGNYAAYNAPPVFNNRYLRPALQFKKYPQRVIFNYAMMLGGFAKDPEQRKALGIALATQALVAGTMGWPTEPFKYLATGLAAAGIGGGWDSWEHDYRLFLSRMMGPELSQIVARGLPRWAGVDLSRLGHADLLTFGQPRGMTRQDIAASVGNLLMGAPGGMALEVMDGAKAAAEAAVAYNRGAGTTGNQKALEALRNLVPIKIGADIVEAYLRNTESAYTTTRGGLPLQPRPYGVGETVTRAAGLSPGWEAEAGEARRYLQKQARAVPAERSEFIRQWVTATPAERNTMQASIDEWNRTHPMDQYITRGELIKAQSRRHRMELMPRSDLGVQLTRRTQFLRPELEAYNIPAA